MEMLKTLGIAAASVMLLAAPALAAEGQLPAKWALSFSFEGPFGKFTVPSCSAATRFTRKVLPCHSMQYVLLPQSRGDGRSRIQRRAGQGAGRDLHDADIWNDANRAARPRCSDRFPVPFANEQAARSANGGAYRRPVADHRAWAGNDLNQLVNGILDPPAG